MFHSTQRGTLCLLGNRKHVDDQQRENKRLQNKRSEAESAARYWHKRNDS